MLFHRPTRSTHEWKRGQGLQGEVASVSVLLASHPLCGHFPSSVFISSGPSGVYCSQPSFPALWSHFSCLSLWLLLGLSIVFLSFFLLIYSLILYPNGNFLSLLFSQSLSITPHPTIHSPTVSLQEKGGNIKQTQHTMLQSDQAKSLILGWTRQSIYEEKGPMSRQMSQRHSYALWLESH